MMPDPTSPRPLLWAPILLALFLSGCTQGGNHVSEASKTNATVLPPLFPALPGRNGPPTVILTPPEIQDLPPPSTLAVPRWQVGYHWEYQLENGNWQNNTVEAVETHNGRPSYRVQITQSPPNDFGETTATAWVDQATLGLIAEDTKSASVAFNPPDSQLFPMQDRSYNLSESFAGMGGTLRANYTVYGWQNVSLPMGLLPAVKAQTKTPSTNETWVSWYSPNVLNTIAWDNDPYHPSRQDLYRLVSWGKTPGGVESQEATLFNRGDPGTLSPPHWATGDHWEYRNQGSDVWQNWTVVGLESFNGHQAYKVRVNFTPTPGYDVHEFLQWYDPATLGTVGQQIGPQPNTYDPPFNQAFPMQNRDYNSTWHSGENSMDLGLYLLVQGWEDLPGAAAPASGIRLETQQRDGGVNVMWYNPQVEGFMGYTRDGTYLLASWGTGAGS